MNYDYYKIFYCVGKHKNITKAAAELYSSQPAVTRVIQNLESELGCKLFIRNKSGVEFTHEGQLLYEYVSVACRQLIRGEEELSRAVGVDGGIIYIGATVTALHCYLFGIMDEYRIKFPNVKVKIWTGSSDKTIDSLKNGTVDLAFVTTPFSGRRDLSATGIRSFRDILIAGNRFKDAPREGFDLNDLKKYPFICLAKGMQQRQFIDRILEERNVNALPDIEPDSADLIVPMVEHNWGLAFCPEGMAQSAISDGRVFEIKLAEELPKRQVCVISDPSHPQSRAARELLRLIKSKKV